MNKRDCFAFLHLSNGQPVCGCLETLDCDGCVYYKTFFEETDKKTRSMIKTEQEKLEEKIKNRRKKLYD